MTESRPITVLGATGKTGRAVIARLAAAGVPARPVSRSSAVPFDWTDESTWSAAIDGAAAVYLVPPEPGIASVDPFLAGLAAGGVERVVLLSARAPGQSGTSHLADVEDAVRASPLRWTIVRPSWFNQNFDAGYFRADLDAGELLLPVGEGREPFVDTGDIADVVVAALTDDRHQGETYELSGPEAVTFADAVGRIASASGRSVQFADVDSDAYVERLASYGVPAQQISTLRHLFDAIRRGDNDFVSDGVERALGRPPRTFDDYARRTWAPNHAT